MPTLDETKQIRDIVKTGGDTLLAKIHEGKHDEGLAAWRNTVHAALVQTVKGQDHETVRRLADALGYQAVEGAVTNLRTILGSGADPAEKADAMGKAYGKLSEGLAQYTGLTFGIAAKATSVPGEDARPADRSLDNFRLEYVLTH